LNHRLGSFRRRVSRHFKHNKFHVIAQEVAAETNVDGSFNAITRENPEFNPGVGEKLD
jgi:hypothetical protein